MVVYGALATDLNMPPHFLSREDGKSVSPHKDVSPVCEASMKSATVLPALAHKPQYRRLPKSKTSPLQKMYGTTRPGPHDVTSLTRLLKTSSLLAANGLLDSTLSTVAQIANGDFSRVKVEVLTPSKVVLTVSNKPVITAPTRTR